MTAIAYPCYDLEKATIERGVSCKGCQARLEIHNRGFEDRDKVFSRRSFLTHFTLSEEAQHLWTQSEGGTRPVNEPELTRHRGFFSSIGNDGLPA